MSADAVTALDAIIARRRLRAMRMGTLAIMGLSLLLLSSDWLREEGSRLTLFSGSVLIGAGILLLSRYPSRRVVCAHSLLALLTGAIAALTVPVGSGGLLPGLAWLVLPPIAATALLDARAGWAWLFANGLVATAACLVPPDPTWVAPASHEILLGRLVLLAAVGVILTLQSRGTNDNVRRLREAVLRERHARSQAQLLHETTAAANASRDTEDALRRCLSRVCAAQSWSTGQFFLASAEDGRFRAGERWSAGDLASGTRPATVQPGAELPDDRPAARALTEERILWFGPGSEKSAPLAGVGTAVAVPVFGEGRIVAVLELLDSRERPQDSETLDVLGDVATQIGYRVERSVAEGRIHHLAHFDTLTGLPNRRHFLSKLEPALRDADASGESVALLSIDLDRFKRLNESLGHGLGDRLLAIAGERLAQRVRRGDSVSRIGDNLVSRLGGDQFTVLLPRLSDASDAERVAARLLEAFAGPVLLGRREVFLTASIGIAMYPADAQDAEGLLRCCENALLAVKRAGGNRQLAYSPELDDSAATQLDLEARLHRALDENELCVHYQPIRDARSGRLVAVEALARWHDGSRYVPPDEFIPLAERSGLIERLGEDVLRQACQEAAQWRSGGAGPIRVCVNFSGQQLLSPHLSGTVRAILDETGFEPGLLEIEITESTILQEDDHTLQNIEELRNLGISLAMDDFGTGYASISTLRRFPFDRIKLDRSFVKGIVDGAEARALARSLVSLARSLHLEVVAEGVETEAQAVLLREFDCDLLQGYLFGRPGPGAEIAALLEPEKPAPDPGPGIDA